VLGPVPAVVEAAQAHPGRRGVLANGLRYAVMRNATPKDGVSVRLGVDVGSYEETDAERGYAHFVEHMAFNGTRNVPEDQIEELFAPMGVAFGRDLNAGTDWFATSFQLDLPDSRAEPRAMALRWLRDVADGLDFNDAAVVRERGVIRAEGDTRDGPGMRVWRAASAFRGPNLRSTAREPIGTPESVAAATGVRLRGFYDRWYRPENAVVVMVGDLPLETMEAEVKAAFESWKGKGPAPVRAPIPPFASKRGVDALAISETHLPTAVSVCRMRASDPQDMDEMARLRRQTSSDLWRSILDKRLLTLRQRPETAVAGAASGVDDRRDAWAACVEATAVGDDWKTALGSLETELRRFAADGPTEREVESAIEEIRSRHRGSVSEAPTRSSYGLAGDILGAELDGDTFVTPREAMRVFNLAVEGVTPETIKAAFDRDWSGAGPLVTLNTPEAPASTALADAWRAAEKAPAISKYVDHDTAAWAYSTFGPTGKVAKREPVALGDYVRFRFQNGLVLNYKKTDFVKEGVQVRLSFGAGRHELGRANLPTAALASAVLPLGGLGRHSADDLNAMFGNSSWGAELGIGNDSFVLYAGTNRSSLEVQMNVLAAFASDPGFRDTVDQMLPTAVEATYRAYSAAPGTTASDAMARAIEPDSPSVMPDKAVLLRLRSTQIAEMFKPALTQSPMELTIVGDVPESEVLRMVSATLGALPARKAVDRSRPDAWFLRFPETLPGPVRTVHDGPADQGIALVVWPLYVASPARRKEEYALGVVAEILAEQLRLRVRERLGMTYAPEVSTAMPDNADQGMLVAAVEARPGDLDAVVAQVREAAAALARGEITAKQLEAARTPMLAQMRTDLASNELWVAALDGSANSDEGVKEVLDYAAIMNSLTVDDLRAAAATWLERQPMVVTSVSAAAAKPTRVAR
ncbi:M16 family metallopeptidase, partial [Caulobacter sp. 17J65-9]|uniref:M16 family metallopeptidase n=1 Tax=Caulobacter sp. 17J65-9 TaxID=2709382 RepID=UPI001969BB37